MPAEPSSWQARLAADVAAVLETEPSVESIWLVGSLGSAARVDDWSDVDVAVVVADYALERWYKALDWLRPVGRTWATSQSEAPRRKTIRVVFDDGRRLDLIFFAHSLGRPDLPGTEVWRRPLAPRAGREAGGALSAVAGATPPPSPVAALVNEWRFVASLAVVKLARRDELIGLHLAIECTRLCLVLGMLMRDDGLPSSAWDNLPAKIGEVAMPHDVESGLVAIEQAAIIFEAHLRLANDDHALEPGPLHEMARRLRAGAAPPGADA